MSFLRAYLIKGHGLPPEWAAQYSISQLWHWHVTGEEPRRR
jgi:hypothetical protein